MFSGLQQQCTNKYVETKNNLHSTVTIGYIDFYSVKQFSVVSFENDKSNI